MDGAVMLYTTWPDAETAAGAARAAVEAGLCACANVLSPARSIFRWNGAVETADETPALFKTSEATAARLRDFLVARHPYDLPAVLAFSAAPASSSAYLAWIAVQTPDAQIHNGQSPDAQSPDAQTHATSTGGPDRDAP